MEVCSLVSHSTVSFYLSLGFVLPSVHTYMLLCHCSSYLCIILNCIMIHILFVVLVSVSWCVWRELCCGRPRSWCWTRPRRPWTWRPTTSFRRPSAQSLPTAPSSPSPTASTPSWTMTSERYIFTLWPFLTAVYGGSCSIMCTAEECHTYLPFIARSVISQNDRPLRILPILKCYPHTHTQPRKAKVLVHVYI